MTVQDLIVALGDLNPNFELRPSVNIHNGKFSLCIYDEASGYPVSAVVFEGQVDEIKVLERGGEFDD